MTEEDKTTVRAALRLIQGENYSSYVHPSSAELARGARQKLEKIFKELPKEHVIIIERATIAALEETDPEWLPKYINMDLEMELVPGDFRALSLLRAHSGHRVLFTASYFVAMAEKTNTQARFSSVRAYLAFVDLLVASSNIANEEGQRHRRILQTYLMKLEFGDSDNNDASEKSNADASDNDNGDDTESSDDSDDSDNSNYRQARRDALPNGYCAGNRKNVVVVSKQLKIGYAEMLYLREKLGEKLTGNLLMVFGLQRSSPLELTWKCPGIPSIGRMKASPCSNDKDNDRSSHNVMVGGLNVDNPFYGNFCCQTCHRKFGRREIHMLEAAEARDPNPNGERMERIKYLKEQERIHLERGRLDRDKQIEKKGIDAVREAELPWSRSAQSRKTAKHEKDPEAHSRASMANREAEQKRIQAGGKKKKPGVFRKLMANKLYPPFFMNMLTQATRIWAREFGEPCVYWNDLVALFDILLIREQGELAKVNFQVNFQGPLPKYLHVAYRTAVQGVLNQLVTKKGHWEYPDYKLGMGSTKKRQKKVLFADVVGLLDKKLGPAPTPMQQGAPE
jgi:hypothetical protein